MIDFYTVITNHPDGRDTIANHRNIDAARCEAIAECNFGALFSYVYDGDGLLVARNVKAPALH